MRSSDSNSNADDNADDDKMRTIHVLKIGKLSLAVQRGNSATVLGTISSIIKGDKLQSYTKEYRIYYFYFYTNSILFGYTM